MSNKIAISAACIKVAHDKQKNLQTYRKFIKQAARNKCKFIAFPECSLQGYTWSWDPVGYKYTEDPEQLRYYQEASETVPGPSTNLLSELAADHDMYIQFGLAEKMNSRIFNTAALVGPEGYIGKHRKVHISGNPIFGAGDRFDVYQTKIGRLGMIVCADMQYPESMRTLALRDAEIVVNSTAWGMHRRNPRTDYSGYMYDILCRANAMMNQVWLVAADQLGSAPRSNEYCYGHSRIINPAGQIIADTGYKEGLAIAKIDVRQGIKQASSYKYMGHAMIPRRRPETYLTIPQKSQPEPTPSEKLLELA